MRKTIAILSIFATSMVTSAALAQTPEGAPATEVAAEPTPEPAAPPTPWVSRLVLGIDSAFQNPLSSSLREATDIDLGILARAEFEVMPRLNLTARAGYLYSLQKADTVDGNKVKNSLDNIPVWLGAKYFVWDKFYGAAEFGLNVLTSSTETTELAGGDIEKTTETFGEYKVGMNVGAGVLVKSIDIRAQLAVLDLAKMVDTMAILVSAGFNILPW